jgi:hypothetical protein
MALKNSGLKMIIVHNIMKHNMQITSRASVYHNVPKYICLCQLVPRVPDTTRLREAEQVFCTQWFQNKIILEFLNCITRDSSLI